MMNRVIRYGLLVAVITIGLIAARPVEDIQDIIGKLEAYYKTYPQVRVHLTFNQPKYAPGDTAFFKAFFLSENFRAIPDKQILNLELNDSEGHTVLAQNFRVTDGEGSNQIIFDKDIAPGRYEVVAYSQVMKNFDPVVYYRKQLTVTGRKQIQTQKGETFGFFTEGGHLVEDVVNQVVIKSSVKGTGKIIDQTGALVASAEAGEDGIASLSFAPKKGSTYIGQLGSREVPLPVSSDHCAIKVESQGTGGVNVAIAVSPSSPLNRQELYFIALSKGRVVYSSPFKVDDGAGQVSIDILHPGLNEFFIFDKKNNLLAERIYFLDPSVPKVLITAANETITPRNVISASIIVTDEMNRPTAASIVARATNNSLFPGIHQASFETEMNIFNDFPGLRLEFESSGLPESEWLTKINDRLIAEKWSRIDWSEVFDPSKDKTKYGYKFSLGFNGKAMVKSSGEPVSDSTLVMIYQQKAMVGYETYTDKKGEFSFPFVYDFNGTDQIFYMMEFKRKEKQQDYYVVPELQIASASETEAKELDQTDVYGEYKFRKRMIDRSFNFFSESSQKIDDKIVNPNVEYEDELGGVDVTVKVEDYLVFPTMSDLIHEVISGLQHRVSGGVSTVRVVFLRNTYTVIPKGDPLYIIDGVFTRNTDYFMSLNTEDILTIKLVNEENKLRRFGGMGKFGIVLVQTKKSVAKDVLKHSTVFSLGGLSPELDFKIPQYNAQSISRRPDLRSCIYWSPRYSTNSSGRADLNFYASDDAAPVRLEILGLTSDGRPFSSTKIIEVRAPEIKQ
ncbi:MAG: hypothetical protein AB7O48_17845 [Cyclobacteriaceae bacterium]